MSATSEISNVHELPPEKLKTREVVHIDIANDTVLPADYKPLRIQQIGENWSWSAGGSKLEENVDPVMTCYKLVTCEFKWFGLQTRIENFIQKSERRLFTNFHRQVSVGWIAGTV
ncbi:unnamed protein product [Ceratitis capitata]|uniref:(Mediterranean fruit fly) hypothetical protein n=1 Tax=Ceratitis capitata TaxID=7213 RepID=A0A811U8W1_CERCA|nr:unnamed protein product [Ceratitis capitata]